MSLLTFICFATAICLVKSSENCTILTVPPNVCGSSQVNKPMCDAGSALKYCTNLNVTSSSDNHAVVSDVESYIAQL